MVASGEASIQEVTWDDDRYYDVAFHVAVSRRYHAYMREFYQRCHDTYLVLSTVAGSAAFVSLLPDNASTLPAKVLTFIVALVTVLDLVFDFAKKATLHDDLARRFTALAARMVEEGATPSMLKAAEVERLKIEAAEPTERRLVALWANNDECRSRGVLPNRLVPLTPLQKSWLAYTVRIWGERGIERRMEKLRSSG